MKIFLAQQNYHIGNFESNTAKIIDAINIAKAQNADLIVFSELCICGYAPKDFLEFKDFIDKCYKAIDGSAGPTQSRLRSTACSNRENRSDGLPSYR